MLKIAKIVAHSTANMAGCGKTTDYSCGIRVKMG